MGLTRSYFDTSYKLPADDFHQLESEAMERSLHNHWIKMSLFSEPSSHFVPNDLTLSDVMTPFVKLICHHILLNIGTFPPAKSNRDTGKLYFLFYQHCMTLSHYKLSDGILLYRELNHFQYPEIGVVTQYLAEKDADPANFQYQIGAEILGKQMFRAQALSEAHFSSMSIFSNNFETKYREAFFVEFGYPPSTEEQLSRLFPRE